MNTIDKSSFCQKEQRRVQEPARDDPAERRLALERELSDQAMAALCRTAERYAHVGRGSELARDIVGDVLGDVLTGDLAHAVERPLLPQLHHEVRVRGRREHRRQRAHVSLDTIAYDTDPDPALVIQPEQETFDQDELGAPDAADVVAHLRELARGDHDVEQLLVLNRRDRIPRREVLAAGMTAWRYRAARERLTAYAREALSACTAAALTPSSAEPEPAATEMQRPSPAALAGRADRAPAGPRP